MIENISISLISDALIICLLVATIAYALRLGNYLKRFKQSRADLEGVIQDLALHIDKAEKAVSGLNETVEISAEDLQHRMDKANTMFDELDLVVQTGDRLADRLEDLAIRNRRIIDGGEGDLADLQNMSKGKSNTKNKDSYTKRVGKVMNQVRADTDKPSSVFSIRDREAEGNTHKSGDGFTLDDNEFLSEAERDLYDALQQKKGKA